MAAARPRRAPAPAGPVGPPARQAHHRWSAEAKAYLQRVVEEAEFREAELGAREFPNERTLFQAIGARLGVSPASAQTTYYQLTNVGGEGGREGRKRERGEEERLHTIGGPQVPALAGWLAGAACRPAGQRSCRVMRSRQGAGQTGSFWRGQLQLALVSNVHE